MANPEMKIFSGSAHPALAEKICGYLGMEPGRIERRRFSDGEFWVKFQENIRGRDVFLIQPTHPPADNLMELLIMVDAARRASADRITVVLPYLGYARQDRKDQPRVAIAARLVADLLQAVGVQRIIAMDMHTAQLQGFFSIPVDHLFAANVFMHHFKSLRGQDLVIVSPDFGGLNTARSWAERFGAGLAVIDKRRSAHNKAEVMNVIGDIQDKHVIIVDDIVDTGGTLIKTARRLKELGCGPIHIACTHAILSGDATENIGNSGLIEEFVVADTIPLHEKAVASGLFTVISTAEVFGEAILRIHAGESLSVLFR